MGRMRIKSETQKARRPRSLCFQGISGTSPTSTMTRDTPLKQTRRPVSTHPLLSPRVFAPLPSLYPYFFHFLSFFLPFFSFFLSLSKERTSFETFFAIYFFFFLNNSNTEFFLSDLISSFHPFFLYFSTTFRKFVYPSRRFKRWPARDGLTRSTVSWNCVSYRAPCHSAVSVVIRSKPLPFLQTPSVLYLTFSHFFFFFLVSPAVPCFFQRAGIRGTGWAAGGRRPENSAITAAIRHGSWSSRRPRRWKLIAAKGSSSSSGRGKFYSTEPLTKFLTIS